MSDQSITVILRRLRSATTDEERQAAAAALYRCYRGRVEQVARGRLSSGPGLADEEDIAQSAFRSFFTRFERGQLDALVNGGQAWAILARLTRNKAIDSVRYDNAVRRGGEGGRRNLAAAIEETDGQADRPDTTKPETSTDVAATKNNEIADGPPKDAAATSIGGRSLPPRGEELPLDAVRDLTQRPGDEHAESNEVIQRFLEELSEATLRGIVSLKMEGFTNEEIAEKLGCATRTVERKLNLIRRLWIPILEESYEPRRS